MPSAEHRFAFGENWRRFLGVLDKQRITEVERLLLESLGEDGIRGKTFLDVDSGEGWFSLSGPRLCTSRVHSVDSDPASVGCAMELRRRVRGTPKLAVERGDVPDDGYVASRGTFDGVLLGRHLHTRCMWWGLRKIKRAVAPGGRPFSAIYNDQRFASRFWRRFYRLPAGLRAPHAVAVVAPREVRSLLARTFAAGPPTISAPARRTTRREG
jgi:2-polyprenyl-6-hydroxyphenyl methylase/3-demethylubiquinone-9 3-methyltransferase